mmetsp:Transcript_1680/g.5790  ORF Transcript_1680/g.5790 Transcript_1680/m.5790 type:complete len:205 (-) Transcript_1680:482-1096(-)
MTQATLARTCKHCHRTAKERDVSCMRDSRRHNGVCYRSGNHRPSLPSHRGAEGNAWNHNPRNRPASRTHGGRQQPRTAWIQAPPCRRAASREHLHARICCAWIQAPPCRRAASREHLHARICSALQKSDDLLELPTGCLRKSRTHAIQDLRDSASGAHTLTQGLPQARQLGAVELVELCELGLQCSLHRRVCDGLASGRGINLR